jgi:26S proteasome regulatory subunit N11
MLSVMVADSVISETLRMVCTGLASSQDGTSVEISGLLLGREIAEKLLVTSAIAGDQISNAFGSELDENFMAGIAHSIMTGKRKDRIVGMFHSHPGIGIFMSRRDVRTLANFQRLYPRFLMMVIDPLTRVRYRFFTYDDATRSAHVLPVQVIR